MKMKHAMQPARAVVEKLGGCRSVARTLKLSPSTISRWMTASEAKGTGGRIPQKYWAQILDAAASAGKPMDVKDLAGM